MCYTNSTVSEEATPHQDGSEAPHIVSESQASKAHNESSATQPATQQQLADVKKEMSDYERSSVRWMKVTAVIYAVTALFILLQWHTMEQTLTEMKSSGATATKQLWDAIGNMNWMARTADGALRQTRESMAAGDRQSKAALAASISQGKAGLDVSIRSLEWSQRPWITESSQIAEPIVFNVNGANITFLFMLDNIGHSPADKVWIEAKLMNMIAGGMPSAEDHRRVCEGPPVIPQKTFTLGEVLFPGKASPWAWTWTIPWSEIQGPVAPNLLAPVLYGCIEYNYGLSSKRHSTPFSYGVLQSNGRLIVQDGGFNVSTKEIPPSMLLLRRQEILGRQPPN